MRGAGRAGGRSFRPPRTSQVDRRPEIQELIFDELPVAPILNPIGDGWSISNFDDPVSERDCAAYPASPYCENDFITVQPIGYEFEVRSNECETCVYIYPVILFVKLQPFIICKQDVDCAERRDNPPPRTYKSRRPRRYESVQPNEFLTPECAARINSAYAAINSFNDFAEADEKAYYKNIEVYGDGLSDEISTTQTFVGGFINVNFIDIFPGESITQTVFGRLGNLTEWYFFNRLTQKFEKSFGGAGEKSFGVTFLEFTPASCGGRPRLPPPPPIKPPPPIGFDPEPPPNNPPPNRRRRRRPPMCCNVCNDSADNTAKLLREIREIRKVLGSGKLQKALNAAVGIGDDSITAILNTLAKRIGTNAYPITVPDSLLEGYGNKDIKLQSNAEFLTWLTYQIDGFVGQFPVEIEVKDIDPLKEGDQQKKITLPNISEAIAEIYGLTLKSSVNQEVELNMLLRMAAEIIATKNASIVAQDYARANAGFLGYKGNFKAREMTYNFDFAGANLDPKSKEPIVLEKLLKTVTGYVQGWQLEDKETVVGFLQKLMFSAGIIKAVFFRGKGQQKELNREIQSMAEDEKEQEKRFEQFVKDINDPNSKYNKDSQEKPTIKDVTPITQKPKGGK